MPAPLHRLGGIGIETWIQSYDQAVKDQTKLWAQLPEHHSTGALDEVLAKVQEFMGPEPSAIATPNAPTGCSSSSDSASTAPTARSPTPPPSAPTLTPAGGRLSCQGSIRDLHRQYSLR